MSNTEQVQPKRARVTGIILVNVATFAWATNIVLGRGLRDEVGPLTLAAARFLIASSLLYALHRRQAPQERGPANDRRLLLGMALTGVVLFSPLLYLGLKHTTVVNATLIQALGPLITGILAGLLLGEPMTRKQGIGALLGIAGVSVLISGGFGPVWKQIGRNPGDLILLVAVAIWGLYSVLGRRVTAQRSVISATALSTFLGLPVLLVAAAWELRAGSAADWYRLVPLLIYIGIVPTVVGFVSWNEAVRRLGPSGAMVFYNTLPLYGVLLATVFLGEVLGPEHLAGGGLIIAGALWAVSMGRARRSAPMDGGG